ncbi:MAG: YjgN family protein [Meiothermus sp.]|uniref:YjgN family protein n=1 Tax=Meiothermus sp. TaxID=1955249 RepID=UPI0025FEFA83|nr:YjgN family protein [Meiothermus sp.]MCS7059299.1 YjgN family protein [Meiothermus sp.]MCS7195158.1 YjgN family protein [Meiothermus sp.]MCX7740975.1 YjgN family protein [Meiothermus sp.]MDW8091876.1 YjgN family protein [Meiothermus sp.]MDW8482119.1 YjgN family protein [Meiothermus sp.]
MDPHPQTDWNVVPPQEPRPVQPSGPQTYRLEFRGSAEEFFRIWIVNIVLSVLTLGVYYAWAKVRARRYLYANTYLAGHPFEYLAEPLPILRGNLVVAAGLGLYYLVNSLYPELGLLVLAGGFALLPWVVYQTLRFTAHNSAYRGIRFGFWGGLREAYSRYFWLGLLALLTLGLATPYVRFRQRQYIYGHIAYGTTRSRFSGQLGFFWAVYLKAVGLALLLYFGAGLLVGLGVELAPPAAVDLLSIPALGLLAFLVLVVVQQYVYARLANHTWSHTALGPVRLQARLRARDLVWISLTNLLFIALTLGLAIPWAKVRYLRYVLEHLEVRSEADLDGFVSAEGSGRVAGLGEAATDILGLEMGL